MTERMIENRIKKIKALEEQKKALEQEIGKLQDEIKKDMEQKELTISGWRLYGSFKREGLNKPLL